VELTPNLRLPYPDDNDPGDGALDLQVFAEAVDAAATQQIAALRSTINKPCRVAQLTVATAGIAANQNTDIFNAGGTWTNIYDSTGVVTTNPFDQRGLGTAPGIYHLGVGLVYQVTGATTANSVRQIQLTAAIPSDRTVFPSTVSNLTAYSSNYDPSAGAMAATVELEVYTPFPSVSSTSTSAGTVFSALFLHQNVASTVQIITGSYAYIYRAADVEAI
jgi:hypothetical protein